MSGPRHLRLRVARDAIVVPRPDHTDKEAGAGVIRRTADGFSVVGGTGTRRRGREYVAPPPTEAVEPTQRLDAAVYAGFLYAHYGHFLLESIGRLWFEHATSPDDPTPIVWVAGTTDRFTPWMTELLDLLGVGRNRTVVDGSAVAVDELLVPDQGFEVHRYLHPWFRDRLEVTDARPDGSRLWLSRTGLGSLAGVAEEAGIEDRLRRDGWTIVHPEQLTMAQQVDLLARAERVAGIEGSAFHTLLLVRGFAGTIDVLTRHDNPNFELIAAAAGWDQVRHPMPGGAPEEWHRPSGARDVRWSGIDVDVAVRTIRRSSRRQRWRTGRAVVRSAVRPWLRLAGRIRRAARRTARRGARRVGSIIRRGRTTSPGR